MTTGSHQQGAHSGPRSSSHSALQARREGRDRSPKTSQPPSQGSPPRRDSLGRRPLPEDGGGTGRNRGTTEGCSAAESCPPGIKAPRAQLTWGRHCPAPAPWPSLPIFPTGRGQAWATGGGAQARAAILQAGHLVDPVGMSPTPSMGLRVPSPSQPRPSSTLGGWGEASLAAYRPSPRQPPCRSQRVSERQGRVRGPPSTHRGTGHRQLHSTGASSLFLCSSD